MISQASTGADAAPVAIENLAGSALKQAREQRPADRVVVSVLATAPLTLGDAGQCLLDVLPAARIGRFAALLTGDTTTHDGTTFHEAMLKSRSAFNRPGRDDESVQSLPWSGVGGDDTDDLFGPVDR